MNQTGTNNSKIILPLLCLALGLGLSAAADATETFPATDAGATSLLKEFVKPGADHAALSKQLRPTAADYAAVFDADSSTKVAAVYDSAWDGGQMMVAPKAGQTEIKVFSATSDEMKSWSGNAAEFAGGWKDVAPKLKPGLKIYRFKFVEPGKDSGMAFDGLIHINGNWRIFPKPWRALGK
jgi:hypothetical protein